MKYVIYLISGTLFGLGLAISGMISPAKIVGFLDVTGNWDPSLAFVMGGALAIGTIGFRFILNRPTSLLGLKLQLPTKKDLDRNLLAGSALFGVGWALAGLCPGPAIASLHAVDGFIIIFLISMTVGILSYRAVTNKKA